MAGVDANRSTLSALGYQPVGKNDVLDVLAQEIRPSTVPA